MYIKHKRVTPWIYIILRITNKKKIILSENIFFQSKCQFLKLNIIIVVIWQKWPSILHASVSAPTSSTTQTPSAPPWPPLSTLDPLISTRQLSLVRKYKVALHHFSIPLSFFHKHISIVACNLIDPSQSSSSHSQGWVNSNLGNERILI